MGLLNKEETMRKSFLAVLPVISILILIFSATAFAVETNKAVSNEELAKKLQNPIAYLISVPFQNNFLEGLGPTLRRMGLSG